jgi:hypothetical protein
MEIKFKVLGIALVSLFLCTLFLGIATSGNGTNGYDPWVDLNDDGNIDYNDLYTFARAYGSSGTPINKTALLLELLSRIDSLNASLIALESRVEALEARIPKKGSIFIAPAAFTPEDSSSSYGKNYVVLHGDGGFNAQLQLPSGVIIKNMTCYLTDMVNDGEVTVMLLGMNFSEYGTYGHGFALTVPLGMVETGWIDKPGGVILYDDTIADNKIDNQYCTYTIEVYFTYDTPFLAMGGIRIDYEYPQ